MMRVLSYSTSRADLGLLEPVWKEIIHHPDAHLDIFLTGMHCLLHPADLRFHIDVDAGLHTGGADLGSSNGAVAAGAMADITRDCSHVIRQIAPDMILAVGDRLDMLAAVTATTPFNLPILHIHGGELSYGAIDDRARHAISKLSHLHAVSTDEAGARLNRMGEEHWRIKVTGAPGLDMLATQPHLDRNEFCAAVGLPHDHPFVLVTVHPETNAVSPGAAAEAVFTALENISTPVLLTGSNTDPGAKLYSNGWRLFARVDCRSHFMKRWVPNCMPMPCGMLR